MQAKNIYIAISGILIAIVLRFFVKDRVIFEELDYEGAFDRLQVPQYVNHSLSACAFLPQPKGRMISITAVTIEDLQDHVFVMLNGQNEGRYISWLSDGDDECLYKLAYEGALALGADERLVENDLRLLDQFGVPLKTAAQVSARRKVHVLLDSEIWVWPGIQVGHEFQVDDVKFTTMSLSPKVFMVENFLSNEEIDYIMKTGEPKVQQSFLNFSTNDEYWFPDSNFSFTIRRRLAKVTRLPTPMCTETFRLNRYIVGQLNALHTDYILADDLRKSQFYPKGSHEAKYLAWADWAQHQIDSVEDPESIPQAFRPGEKLYPASMDKLHFQHELLQLFLNYYYDKTIPLPDHAPRLVGLVELYLSADPKHPVGEIIEHMCRLRLDFWDTLRQVWEHEIGDPRFQYQPPQNDFIFGISHYFRWIRWCKEQIEQHREQLPSHIKPGGKHYPVYYREFQNHLLKLILQDYGGEELYNKYRISEEGLQNLKSYQDKDDILHDILRDIPEFFQLIPPTWERHAGTSLIKYKIPRFIKHFYPQRFVTLVMSLADVEEGGETVFPYSKERYGPKIYREGMDGCSQGLAIPPKKNRGLIFYSQTPDLQEDLTSRHGGCPPIKGTKCTYNRTKCIQTY